MFHMTNLILNAVVPAVPNMMSRTIVQQQQNPEHQRFSSSSTLNMATAEDKAVIHVTGEALEMVLQEWDQPLVGDAFATW